MSSRLAQTIVLSSQTNFFCSPQLFPIILVKRIIEIGKLKNFMLFLTRFKPFKGWDILHYRLYYDVLGNLAVWTFIFDPLGIYGLTLSIFDNLMSLFGIELIFESVRYPSRRKNSLFYVTNLTRCPLQQLSKIPKVQ